MYMQSPCNYTSPPIIHNDMDRTIQFSCKWAILSVSHKLAYETTSANATKVRLDLPDLQEACYTLAFSQYMYVCICITDLNEKVEFKKRRSDSGNLAAISTQEYAA